MEASQVLAYLNMLGYRNISAQQLKEFMRDLKKLIKFDQQFKYKEDNSLCTNISVNERPNFEHLTEIEDIFEHLYKQQTVSSLGKTAPSTKQKKITVRITRKPVKKSHNHCVDVEKNPICNCKPHSEKLSCESNTRLNLVNVESSELESQSSEQQVDNGGEKQQKEMKNIPESSQSVASNTKVTKKSSNSSRPSTAKQINRCDPVALFQYYQSEWKKQKFPGKENHSDLRWAIREKLLGGPPIEIPMTNKTSCRKSNICSNPSFNTIR